MYETTIVQMSKMIKSLSAWIDKAVAYAEDKKFDPSVLLNARLAPDQYHFIRQVQAVCDAAKFAPARLTGREAPKHPDTEETVEELRARIKSTLEFLDTFKPEDLANTQDNMVKLPFMEGKQLRGSDYVNELVLPNFYFHVTTAYAILRHNGVDLGKRDYIGSLNLQDI